MNLLAYIALLAPVAIALCPFQNAFSNDNYCYFLLDRSDISQNQGGNSWQLAEDHCVRLGGHLASVNTGELNELLRGQVQYKANQAFWLGLRAQKSGGDGKFKLEWSDNSTVSYTNWAKDGLSRDSGCAVMRYTGQWFLADCYSSPPMNFVCKLPDVDPPQQKPPQA